MLKSKSTTFSNLLLLLLSSFQHLNHVQSFGRTQQQKTSSLSPSSSTRFATTSTSILKATPAKVGGETHHEEEGEEGRLERTLISGVSVSKKGYVNLLYFVVLRV